MAMAVRWLVSGLSRSAPIWSDRFKWAARGLRPFEAMQWNDVAVGPTAAARLVSEGLGPTDLAGWTDDAGRAARLEALVDADLTLEQLVSWAKSHMPVAEAKDWIKAGFASPSQLGAWRRLGLPPAEAGDFRAVVGVAAVAKSWLDHGVRSADLVAAWVDSGFGPSDAERWLGIGIDEPKVARALNQRISKNLVARLRRVGFRGDEIVVWCDTGANVNDLAALAATAKVHPDAPDAWRQSRNRVDTWPTWMPLFPESPSTPSLWKQVRLKPGDVAAIAGDGQSESEFLKVGNWLAQGTPSTVATMRRHATPVQIREWALADADFLQALAMVKPQPRSHQPSKAAASGHDGNESDAYRYKLWALRGEVWLKPVLNQSARFEPFLRRLFDDDLDWLEPADSLNEPLGTEDWLVEVVARAESLQPSLTRAPEFPMTFDGPTVTIHLDVCDEMAAAWVGAGDRGVFVGFHTTRFDLWYNKHHPSATTAAGLAVGWFLDCTVGLRKHGTHPHLSAAGAPRGSPTRQGSAYVPTPSFDDYLATVASGASTSPAAHRVAGHVRHLGAGRTPRDEARRNAPAYVRVTMGPRDTFVRAYDRGTTEAREEMEVHLSKYSSLADALGSLHDDRNQRSRH